MGPYGRVVAEIRGRGEVWKVVEDDRSSCGSSLVGCFPSEE